MLTNIRVGDKETKEILDIFYHLLDQNQDTFLSDEVKKIIMTNDQNEFGYLFEYISLC